MKIFVFDKSKKYCEKMLVDSIFFFSHNVVKGFFPKGIKCQDCVVEGRTIAIITGDYFVNFTKRKNFSFVQIDIQKFQCGAGDDIFL